MKSLILLLFSGAVLASVPCYEGSLMPQEKHLNVVDSSTGSCVLMFEADDVCDHSSTNSSLLLRAESALYRNENCWMPYPNHIWCYCSQPLCNDPKQKWWFEQILRTTVNTTEHQLTKNCALNYIQSLNPLFFETSTNSPYTDPWKETFGYVSPKASNLLHLGLGTLLITFI